MKKTKYTLNKRQLLSQVLKKQRVIPVPIIKMTKDMSAILLVPNAEGEMDCGSNIVNEQTFENISEHVEAIEYGQNQVNLSKIDPNNLNVFSQLEVFGHPTQKTICTDPMSFKQSFKLPDP